MEIIKYIPHSEYCSVYIYSLVLYHNGQIRSVLTEETIFICL